MCVFSLCFPPSSSATFFFFSSSPDLNFCLYSPYILQNFRFKNTKFSASDRAHPTQTPPMPCVQACNWRWRSTKFTPHCRRRVYSRAALCSFGVLASCCKFFGRRVMEESESLIAMIFSFFFSYTKIPGSFTLACEERKLSCSPSSEGNYRLIKENIFTWWSLFTL